MSVLYTLIDDVCSLIFTREYKNKNINPRLGSVPSNHLRPIPVGQLAFQSAETM